MLEKLVVRRLFLASPALRSSLQLSSSWRGSQISSNHRLSTSVPSVTQPSFWASLVPKPLRRTPHLSENAKKPKSKEWNPATFFIIIFLLIGSMSIQMIALRNDFAAFNRRADAKIDLLREVIERVQKGEDVDVEGLLGTDDVEKEKEWEEVLREIEREDELWVASRRKKPRRVTETGQHTPPVTDNTISSTPNNAVENDIAIPKGKSKAPPGFY